MIGVISAADIGRARAALVDVVNAVVAIGLPLGRSPVGSSPRSSGIQVSCTRASALS